MKNRDENFHKSKNKKVKIILCSFFLQPCSNLNLRKCYLVSAVHIQLAKRFETGGAEEAGSENKTCWTEASATYRLHVSINILYCLKGHILLRTSSNHVTVVLSKIRWNGCSSNSAELYGETWLALAGRSREKFQLQSNISILINNIKTKQQWLTSSVSENMLPTTCIWFVWSQQLSSPALCFHKYVLIIANQ